MSFQSKGFWMLKNSGVLTDGELTYDSTPRVEPKRTHHWLVDGSEAEMFPNKKQDVEVPSSSSFTGGVPSSNISSWGNKSGFNYIPSQLNERLLDTDSVQNMNFDERTVSSINAENLNMGRDIFGNSSSFGLSISQSLEVPKLGMNFGGIRKVKVSEVRDSENLMGISVGPSFTREDSVLSSADGYSKMNNSGISMSLTYVREEDTAITLGESFGREDDNFISVGQSFNKGDVSAIALGQSYKSDCSTMPITNSFCKADNSFMSIAENLSKGDDTVIFLGNPCKGNENMISMSQTYKGGSSDSVSKNHTIGTECTVSVAQSISKGENHTLSLGKPFDKGESNIISFGGQYDDEIASGRLICSYDLPMGQASGQGSNILNQKDLIISNCNAVIGSTQVLSSGVQSAFKRKEDHKLAKKMPPNNFPSNVRSLLSTCILDEVPVKYVAWSREKELRGIIKGSGYLCGCQSCNFSKVINAYELERHAGCKTKHPNNHIYFENGKTIYGVVQELRSTPPNMLFDAIQTITGSPINQKSFCLWKESFLAATRELQRIYGKDERNQTFTCI